MSYSVHVIRKQEEICLRHKNKQNKMKEPAASLCMYIQAACCMYLPFTSTSTSTKILALVVSLIRHYRIAQRSRLRLVKHRLSLSMVRQLRLVATVGLHFGSAELFLSHVCTMNLYDFFLRYFLARNGRRAMTVTSIVVSIILEFLHFHYFLQNSLRLPAFSSTLLLQSQLKNARLVSISPFLNIENTN
jgi:hypothetical protein